MKTIEYGADSFSAYADFKKLMRTRRHRLIADVQALDCRKTELKCLNLVGDASAPPTPPRPAPPPQRVLARYECERPCAEMSHDVVRNCQLSLR